MDEVREERGGRGEKEPAKRGKGKKNQEIEKAEGGRNGECGAGTKTETVGEGKR